MASTLRTCKYCNIKFNIEKEPFVQIPWGQLRSRYGHANCYKLAKQNGQEKETYEIWDPVTDTICFWCHKGMHKDANDVIVMPQLPNRYVHKQCNENHPANDEEKLILYIIKLFQLKEDYVLPKYQKQLKQYKEEYNFTYSGMLKALKYWYEVKKHPIDLNRGVGAIIQAYKPAYDYYYAIYMADLENQNKNFNDYIPKDIEIKIIPPEKQVIKRKLFTFLDEEKINAE